MSIAYSRPVVPRLETGDVLTRQEFEERYSAMPELKKAELIEGVVYVPSPVRVTEHGQPHFRLSAWMAFYSTATPQLIISDNSSVRLNWRSEPQPDLLVSIPRESGGQAVVDDDGYLSGAPEFVAEISASSVSYDLTTKFDLYLRSGVREYVVWRVLDGALDWFVLRGHRYEQLAPGPDGILRSEVLPGLWLDPAALLAGDLARVMAMVQEGVATDEHGEFVRKLAAA